MLSYILKRLAGMIVVMFLVMTIVFVIVRVTPGDPAAVMLGPEATAQDVAESASRTRQAPLQGRQGHLPGFQELGQIMAGPFRVRVQPAGVDIDGCISELGPGVDRQV